jgi:hypothetical protein
MVRKGPESKIDADMIIWIIRLHDQMVIILVRCQKPMVLWRRMGVDVVSVYGGG